MMVEYPLRAITTDADANSLIRSSSLRWLTIVMLSASSLFSMWGLPERMITFSEEALNRAVIWFSKRVRCGSGPLTITTTLPALVP